MVHALREVREALAAGGTLLDLRPVAARPPIEVVTPRGAVRVGAVDDSAQAPDDAAADGAIRQAVGEGWLVHQRTAAFDTEHIWDTVEEMASFIATRRHPLGIDPPYADLTKIQRRLGAEGGARLRCRWQAVLGVYRRCAGGCGR